jgi:hypothetical protein
MAAVRTPHTFLRHLDWEDAVVAMLAEERVEERRVEGVD